MRARASGVLLLLAAALACGGGEVAEPAPAAPDSEPPAGREGPGRLVVVGGGLDASNAEVYEAVVGARHGDGPVCVIPTASGSPERSMRGAEEDFRPYAGARNVEGVLLTVDDPGRAESSNVAARLRRCSGFWFTGGDQSRIADVFLPGGDTTAAFEAVRGRWLEGAVVGGSSAGAAIMSRRMIAGGSSRAALAAGIRETEDGEGVWVRGGLGFLDGSLIDQHFMARGRVGRLLVAVTGLPGTDAGFGIDENTALIVDGDDARVEGESVVLVVDARDAVPGAAGSGATGIRLEVAGDGDRVDLSTLEVTPPSRKGPLARGGPVEPPVDPFADWAFLHLLADLAASGEPSVEIPVGTHTLRLSKGEGFRAVAGGPAGPDGTPGGLSAGPYVLDLVPR